jgi:hypothetical protein
MGDAKPSAARAPGLGHILRTGEALLYPDVPAALLVEAAVDERHLELLRAVGLRSVLMLPMQLGARILGALTLVNSDFSRGLDRFDQQLAEPGWRQLDGDHRRRHREGRQGGGPDLTGTSHHADGIPV